SATSASPLGTVKYCLSRTPSPRVNWRINPLERPPSPTNKSGSPTNKSQSSPVRLAPSPLPPNSSAAETGRSVRTLRRETAGGPRVENRLPAAARRAVEPVGHRLPVALAGYEPIEDHFAPRALGHRQAGQFLPAFIPVTNLSQGAQEQRQPVGRRKGKTLLG